MNKSIKKCCICSNSETGEFIMIGDNKYHLSCIEKMQKEKQELKEQLEEKNDFINKLQATKDRLDKYDYERTNQQKEFIEWLEKEIEAIENKLNRYNELVKQGKETDFEYYESIIDERKFDIYMKTLRKYKEIIGVKDD